MPSGLDEVGIGYVTNVVIVRIDNLSILYYHHTDTIQTPLRLRLAVSIFVAAKSSICPAG